jgi:glycosyltransferase involved in cell wall biosynthesis
MIVTFILPSAGENPIGGFKIIYEYANRLACSGISVNLIHPFRISQSRNIVKKIFRQIKFNEMNKNQAHGPSKWFLLDERIKLKFIPVLKNDLIPDADYIFATEYSTAKPVLHFDDSKGKKFYFIQSLETWLGPEKDVIETWKYPMSKIVISKWLQRYAAKLGEEAFYIPNGFDFTKFAIDVLPKDKNKFEILMLYHKDPVKGSIYGLEAIKELKRNFSSLKFSTFSSFPRNRKIPAWISYHHRPEQTKLRHLYNRASIFISPSLFEGFPLPPAESMMCGCAVVATDIGGHAEYCFDNQTALLVKPKSINDIVEKVGILLHDNELRIRIAEKANENIRQFTWDKSVNKLISILK